MCLIAIGLSQISEIEVPQKPISVHEDSPKPLSAKNSLTSFPEQLGLQASEPIVQDSKSPTVSARPDSIRSISSIEKSVKRNDSYESSKSPQAVLNEELSSKLSPKQEHTESHPPVPKYNRSDSSDSFKKARDSFQGELGSKFSQQSTPRSQSIETPSKRQDSYESFKSAKSHHLDEQKPRTLSKDELTETPPEDLPKKRQESVDSVNSVKSARNMFQNELNSKLANPRTSVHSTKSYEKPALNEEPSELAQNDEILDHDLTEAESSIPDEPIAARSIPELPPKRQESYESAKSAVNAYQNELNAKLSSNKPSIQFNPNDEVIDKSESESTDLAHSTSEAQELPSYDQPIQRSYAPSLPSVEPTTPLSKHVLSMPITPTVSQSSTIKESKAEKDLPSYSEPNIPEPTNEKDPELYAKLGYENVEKDSDSLPPVYDNTATSSTTEINQTTPKSSIQETEKSIDQHQTTTDEAEVDLPAQARDIELASTSQNAHDEPKLVKDEDELESDLSTKVDEAKTDSPKVETEVEQVSSQAPEDQEPPSTVSAEKAEDDQTEAQETPAEPEPSPQPTILSTALNTESPKLSHATRSRAGGRRAGRTAGTPKTPVVSQTELLMKSIEKEVCKNLLLFAFINQFIKLDL